MLNFCQALSTSTNAQQLRRERHSLAVALGHAYGGLCPGTGDTTVVVRSTPRERGAFFKGGVFLGSDKNKKNRGRVGSSFFRKKGSFCWVQLNNLFVVARGAASFFS